MFRTPLKPLILLLLFPALVITATRITNFHGRRQNNAVILEWTTEEESGLVKFQIQRSTDSVSWINIGEKTPLPGTERKLYTFTDNSIFKTAYTGTFYYKLIIIDNQGNATDHDVIVSISGNSGLRHTWGSIKAMFR